MSKFLSKIANAGDDSNGDGKLRLREMIHILWKAAGDDECMESANP